MRHLSIQSRRYALFALLLLLFSQQAVAVHAGAADHQLNEVCDTCANFDRLDSTALAAQLPALTACTTAHDVTTLYTVAVVRRCVTPSQRGPPIFQ